MSTSLFDLFVVPPFINTRNNYYSLFQPLYEAQNIKSQSRYSGGSGTSQGSGDQFVYNRAPPGGQPQQGMSSISNNLSELDQLLSDLNSAQFLAEVDKKHPSSGESTIKFLNFRTPKLFLYST